MHPADMLEEIRAFRDRAIELRECKAKADEALDFAYKVLALEVPNTFLGRSKFMSEERAGRRQPSALSRPPPSGQEPFVDRGVLLNHRPNRGNYRW